jgi:hypothetical protein
MTTTITITVNNNNNYRIYGLVIRVPSYRSRDYGFDSRRYEIFWEVVCLEQGPLTLVSITQELLEWKSSGSGSRIPRLTVVGIRCADHATPLCPQKLALSSPTSGDRSVGIVRLRTKATEFSFYTAIIYTIFTHAGNTNLTQPEFDVITIYVRIGIAQSV